MSSNHRTFLSIAFASLVLLTTFSCATNPQAWRAGVEVQAYPAGVIAGPQVQYALTQNDALLLRLAVNTTDRQDFGEHDNEEGQGYGLGLGWRRYQHADRSGWLYGARADLWSLEIDWRDNSGTPKQGSTDVLVLQPTLEGGYSWLLGSGNWSLDLTAGLGAEINLQEDGDLPAGSTQREDVGEGAIFLLGVTFLYNG